MIPERLKLDWWRLRIGGGWCEVGEVLADGAGVMYLGVGTMSNTGPSYIPRVTPCLILAWKEYCTGTQNIFKIEKFIRRRWSVQTKRVWVNTDEPANSSWEASRTLQDERKETNTMLYAVSCLLSLGDKSRLGMLFVAWFCLKRRKCVSRWCRLKDLKKRDGIISQTLDQAPDAERKRTVFFFWM